MRSVIEIRFQRDDVANPLGEGCCGRNAAGEIGVVKVAMGIDEAGHEYDLAQVGNR